MHHSGKTPLVAEPKVLIRAVLATFFLTCALIAVNISDSMIYKPMVVLTLVPVLFAAFILRFASPQGREFHYSWGHVFLLTMLAGSAFSLFGAINLGMSLKAIGMQVCCALFFMTAYEAMDSAEAMEFAKSAMLWIAAFECTGGFFLYYTQGITGMGVLMAQPYCVSTFGNSMFFAGYLALMIPFTLGIFFEEASWSRRRGLSLAVIIAAAYLLILTGSRGAWIGASVGVLGFVIASSGSRRVRLIATVVLAAAACCGLWIFSMWMARRASQPFAANTTSTFARRLFFYQGAWKAFLASPIYGHGAGDFSAALPEYRSPEYWMVKSEDLVTHAHNEYLETLAETGLLGFLAFISFFCWYFVTIVRGIRRNMGRGGSTFLPGCLFGVVAILVTDLGAFNLRSPSGMLLVLLVIALSVRAAAAPDFSFHIALRQCGALRLLLICALAVYLFVIGSAFWSSYQGSRFEYLGLQAESLGKASEQLTNFQNAVQFRPGDDEVRYRYANALLDRNDYATAAAQCSIILSAEPYYPKARLIRSIAESELGNEAAASTDIAEELKLENEPLTVYYASYFEFRRERGDRELAFLSLLLRNSMKSSDTEYVARALSQFAALEKNEPATARQILDSLSFTFGGYPDISSRIDSCAAALGSGPASR